MITIVNDHYAERQIGRGELTVSLFGHLEERETGHNSFDVVEVRPLVPFRRPVGKRYRIANKAVILSTCG